MFRIFISIILVFGCLSPVFSQTPETDLVAQLQEQFVGKWKVSYVEPLRKNQGEPAADYYLDIKSVETENPAWRKRHLKFTGEWGGMPLENCSLEYINSRMAFAFTIHQKDPKSAEILRTVYYAGFLIDGKLDFCGYEPANTGRKVFQWKGEKVQQ